VEGLSNCSEAGPEERDFLQGLDAPPDQRLACQVCVHGDVDIEYLGL
jgi:ferredoxin